MESQDETLYFYRQKRHLHHRFKEKFAVAEANTLHIPVIAVIDTNSDPDKIEFPIAANDDAIKSIKVITHAIANAVIEAKQLQERYQSAEVGAPAEVKEGE